MKTINALVSEHFLNLRITRIAATRAALIAMSLGSLFSVAARAQTVTGNAYSIDLGAALGLGVTTTVSLPGAGTILSVTPVTTSLNLGPLAATGSLASPAPKQTLSGVSVSANLSSGLTGLVGLASLGAVANDVLGAGVQTTNTTSLAPGSGFGVTSTASVATVGLFNSATSDVGGGLISIDTLGSLVSATLVQSITSAKADGSGNVGQTIMTGLKVNGTAITNQYFVSQGLSIADSGVVTGSGKIIVNGFTGSRLGELRINEQIANGDGSLTTNALHLVLDPGATIFSGTTLGVSGLTNTVAVKSATSAGAGFKSGIIIASSTAGFSPAAPEPGSLALLAAGTLPAAGLIRRRYRPSVRLQ